MTCRCIFSRNYPRQQQSIKQQTDAGIRLTVGTTPGGVIMVVLSFVFMIGYKHRYFYIVYQIHRIHI